MEPDPVLFNIYIFIMHVAFVLTAGVTALYGIVAKWQRTPEGKYIFMLLGALTLVLGIYIFRVHFRYVPYTIVAAIVFMAYYLVAIVTMGFGIYRATIKRYLDEKKAGQ